MPIAKIQLPDGRVARFEVPQGSTEQDVMSYVESNSNLFTQQEAKEETPIEKAYRMSEPQRDRTKAALRTGYQGATFGFGDEILATGRALGAKALGGEDSFKDYYNIARQEERQKLQEVKNKYPIQSFLTEAGGSILTGGKILKAAGLTGQTTKQVAQSKVGRVLGNKLVQGGALMGGIAGVGETQDITNLPQVAKDTATMAGIGAVATPVIAYGLGKAGAGVSAVSSKIKNLFTKKTPDDKVASMVSKNIPKKDVEAGIKQLEEGTDNLTGLDIDSPAFENMYKTALTKFPDSKQIANEFARGRLDKGYERINKSLDKVSLSKSGRENIVKLNEERKVLVSPLYTIAAKNPVRIPKFNYKTIKTTEFPITTRFSNQTKTSGVRKDMQTDLESTEQYMKGGKATSTYDDKKGTITEGSKFLQSQKETGSFISGTTKGDTITKTQSKIIQKGNKDIKINREITNFKDLSNKEKQIAKQFEEIESNPMYEKLIKSSQEEFSLLNGVNNSRDLMILKEKYNAMNYNSFSKTERDAGDILKSKVDDLLTKLSPEVKQADEIYSNYSKIINAGEEGLKFNSIPKTEIELYIKSLNPKQLEAYRASAKESLLEEVEKNIKTLGKNKPAEAIFNTNYDKTKIKTLFGEDKAGYDAFKKEIIDEINYNKTLEKYGLTNAQVMTEDNILPNLGGRLLQVGTGGGRSGIAFEIGRVIEKIALRRYGLSKNNADLLIKAMTNKENSLKTLRTAYNKISDKEQKKLAKQFIQDISPAITATIID